MPTYDISPRDKRLQRLKTLQEVSSAGTATDLAQQSAMLQQLLGLYGLSERAQQAPEQLRAMQLANEKAAGALPWEETMRQQDYDKNAVAMELAKQQSDALAAKARGEISPDDELRYASIMGPEALAKLPPNLRSPAGRADMEKAKADAASKAWWAIYSGANQARQAGKGAEYVPPAVDLQGQYGITPYDLSEWTGAPIARTTPPGVDLPEPTRIGGVIPWIEKNILAPTGYVAQGASTEPIFPNVAQRAKNREANRRDPLNPYNILFGTPK